MKKILRCGLTVVTLAAIWATFDGLGTQMKGSVGGV